MTADFGRDLRGDATTFICRGGFFWIICFWIIGFLLTIGAGNWRLEGARELRHALVMPVWLLSARLSIAGLAQSTTTLGAIALYYF